MHFVFLVTRTLLKVTLTRLPRTGVPSIGAIVHGGDPLWGRQTVPHALLTLSFLYFTFVANERAHIPVLFLLGGAFPFILFLAWNIKRLAQMSTRIFSPYMITRSPALYVSASQPMTVDLCSQAQGLVRLALHWITMDFSLRRTPLINAENIFVSTPLQKAMEAPPTRTGT